MSVYALLVLVETGVYAAVIVVGWPLLCSLALCSTCERERDTGDSEWAIGERENASSLPARHFSLY